MLQGRNSLLFCFAGHCFVCLNSFFPMQVLSSVPERELVDPAA
jgi:hypothetical protein